MFTGESPLHKCSINGKENLGFPLVLLMETVTNLLGVIHPSSTMQNEPNNFESAVLIFQFSIFFSTSQYLPSTRDIYLKYALRSMCRDTFKYRKKSRFFPGDISPRVWYLDISRYWRNIAYICNYGLKLR